MMYVQTMGSADEDHFPPGIGKESWPIANEPDSQLRYRWRGFITCIHWPKRWAGLGAPIRVLPLLTPTATLADGVARGMVSTRFA